MRKSLDLIRQQALTTDTQTKHALGTSQPKLTETFSSQVDSLINRFYTILSNNSKINQKNSDDIEMMGDLYYQIVRGYTSAPDLHVTWLENLANIYLKVFIQFNFLELILIN